MILDWRRHDLGDLFLAVLAAGMVAGFAVYGAPSLAAIFAGTHRVMRLPDGAQVTLNPRLAGSVDLARRVGARVEIIGWAADPRAAAGQHAPLAIKVYADRGLVGAGATGAPDPQPAGAPPSAHAGQTFRLIVPGEAIPAAPTEPIRVFAVASNGEAVELFRGARPIWLVEDLPQRPGAK